MRDAHIAGICSVDVILEANAAIGVETDDRVAALAEVEGEGVEARAAGQLVAAGAPASVSSPPRPNKRSLPLPVVKLSASLVRKP